MSGFVRGKVECFICNKDWNYNAQNFFKNLYDFFTSHPQYKLIALNYGATNGPAASGAGTGTGYCDQSTTNGGATFGNNAWFVVRANATTVRPFDVYHYFQWCGGSSLTRGATWNTSPAAPSLIHGLNNSSYNSAGAAGIGYQCAIGISGSGGTSGSLGGNPWKGTTNANGADTKPSTPLPVWSAPTGGGTGVMIFPRSNDGDTGAFRASSTVGHYAENCMQIFGTVSSAPASNFDMRMHIIADDDSWVFWADPQDSLSSTVLTFSGIYVPRANQPVGAQSSIIPYMVVGGCADGGTNMPWADHSSESIYGDIAGTQTQQGGIIGNTTASVRPVVIEKLWNFACGASDTNGIYYNPNFAAFSGSKGNYDEFDFAVGIFETTPQQISGYLGTLDFVRAAYNVPGNTPRWDFNRLFVGSQTVNDHKYSIPWDSQNFTFPRSGITRQGITFIRPGPA